MAKKNDVTTFVYRGKLQYAKVLGNPVLNYNEDGNEWKFDFIPNDPRTALKELKAVGKEERVRTKDDYLDGQTFISFKQAEYDANGDPNRRIKVVDAAGNDWPETRLIGNGTVADVKFVVVDYGKGKFKGMYPRSIRILDLVPYERKEFEALPEDDEYAAAAMRAAAEYKQFQEDFGVPDAEDEDTSPVETDELNDDIPLT
jgi:hypothetical protein